MRVLFTDDGGHRESLYSAAVPLGNNLPTGLPTISGYPRVGAVLTASAWPGIADADGITFNNATFAWQWIANDGTSDADIAGATSDTYTLTSAEEGKTIKVRVTFTDDGGSVETLVSEPTEAVIAAGALYARIAGAPGVGESLNAIVSGGPPIYNAQPDQFAYQWISSDGTNDFDIAGATDDPYTPIASDVGKAIKVRVTFTATNGTESTYVSAPTAAIKPVVTLALEDVPEGHDGFTQFRDQAALQRLRLRQGCEQQAHFQGRQPAELERCIARCKRDSRREIPQRSSRSP